MKFLSTCGIFFLTFFVGITVSPEMENNGNIPNRESKDFVIENKEPSNTGSKQEKTTPSEPELEVIDEIDGWTDGESGYPHKIKLLEPGEGFHGEEVNAESGERWLGLFQTDDKFNVKSAKLKIERVTYGLYDEGNGEENGKSVSVFGRNQPMFLFKDSNLSNGEVKTLFRGNTWAEYDDSMPVDEFLTVLKPGFVKNYNIGDKTYSLKVIYARNKSGDKIMALVLEGNGKRQILHTFSEAFNPDVGKLYWVGDLDKDNVPDFYMTLFEHYNVMNRVLFLSSKAKENKIVEKVAYFWTTGC